VNDDHDNAIDDKAILKKLARGAFVVDALEKAALEFATAAALLQDTQDLSNVDACKALTRGVALVLDAKGAMMLDAE